MFIRNCVLLFIIIYNILNLIRGETTVETHCTINESYPFKHVSEKFLSISVDPSDLASLNLSERHFLLAKYLGPAYIRIAGPSTKFVKFINGGEKVNYSLLSDGKSIAVTPYMWFGINEWLKFANLTPVFGISDAETTAGVWNPNSTLPLLKISDQMNVSGYWMLGFDSSNKNEAQYKKDIIIFQNVLATFPKQKESWKIVGSDISHRSNNEVTNILHDLKDTIAAVTWEWSDESFPEEPLPKTIQDKHNLVKIWMVAPKPSHSVSFYSALTWADQVGKAAKMGYDVVFRQLSMKDFLTDTPVYWFSLLHKKLMGTSVFEVRTPATDHSGSTVYAHCTRKGHNLQGKGGLTVMVVNKNRQSYTVKIKWEFIRSTKTMEVQSYILTTLHENSTNVFLNGKLLTLEVLEKDPFQPLLSISKLKTYQSLKVPPLSIAFFVLPKARIRACVFEENETDDQQKVSLSEEMDFTLRPRSSFNRNSTFENFEEKLRKEINFVEKFAAARSRVNKEVIEDITKSDESRERELLWKREELKSQEMKINIESRSCNLTSEEMERTLKERARAKAAENNIVLTEDELDIIVEAVKRTILKNQSKPETTEEALEKPQSLNNSDEILEADEKLENGGKGTSIRKRRDVNMKLLNLRSHLEEHRQHLEDAKDEIVGNAHALKKNIQDRIRKLKNYRSKRDINMEMLRLKTEGRNEEPRRVLDKTKPRKLWQTSDELLSDSEDEKSVERVLPKKEIFSKVAVSDESDDDADFLQPNKYKKLSLLDKLSKFGNTKSNKNKPTLNYRKHKVDSEEIEDHISTSEEFNNIKEDLPCIYEYFGSQRENSDKMTRLGEVRRKLQKLNKGKGKMIKSLEDTASDSMEYLRRKRSCVGNVEHPNQELDYYDVGEEPSKNEVNTDGSINTMVGSVLPENGFPDDGSYKIPDLMINLGGATTNSIKDEVNVATGTDLFEWRSTGNQARTRRDRTLDHIVSEDGQLDKQSTEDKKPSLRLEDDAKKKIYMLKLLKETLTHEKENIDGLLSNQTLQDNADEERSETTKIINQQDSSKVIEKLKEFIKGSRETNANQNSASSSIGIVKRSIVDKEKNAFGNYKSHTSNIKEWKPSDILSLRKPAEGVVMFSQLISRSKDTNTRRKRSKNIDDLDNNIYLNGIEKSVLEMPEVMRENEDYKLKIPQTNEHNEIESTTVLAETSTVQKIKFRGNENRMKNVTVVFGDIIADEVADNIQNTATSKEQSTLDNFLNTMSSFFSNIGEVLGFKLK